MTCPQFDIGTFWRKEKVEAVRLDDSNRDKVRDWLGPAGRIYDGQLVIFSVYLSSRNLPDLAALSIPEGYWIVQTNA
jgi:hypothetical protein